MSASGISHLGAPKGASLCHHSYKLLSLPTKVLSIVGKVEEAEGLDKVVDLSWLGSTYPCRTSTSSWWRRFRRYAGVLSKPGRGPAQTRMRMREARPPSHCTEQL